MANPSNVQQKIGMICIVCYIGFYCCILIAMLLYPGGTNADPSTIGFTFWDNFVSDLITQNARSGANNTASYVIAGIGFVAFAIANVLLAIGLFRKAFNNSIEKGCTKIASVILTGSAVFLVLLLYFTKDTGIAMHRTIATLSFLTGGIGATLLVIGAIARKSTPRIVMSLLLILAIFAWINMIINIGAPPTSALAAGVQKLALFGLVALLLTIAVEMRSEAALSK